MIRAYPVLTMKHRELYSYYIRFWGWPWVPGVEKECTRGTL